MKKVAIFALSILILAQAYAFSQAEAQSSADIVTVSVSTVSPTYQTGDMVEIYGSVSVSSDPLRAFDVALIVKAPNGNLIQVAQITPGADGYYSKSIQSSESWKEGTYTVTANYDIKSASTSFSFNAVGAAAIDEVVEAAEEVAEAAEAVAGEVAEAAEAVAGEVVEAAGGLACGSGTHEADGFCIPDGSDSFGLEYDSTSTGGLILTASIAFGIAVAIIIILRLIGKAGGSR
jgi:pyruvoyl-dependent arginine decarboxylase (PvlArgDC)